MLLYAIYYIYNTYATNNILYKITTLLYDSAYNMVMFAAGLDM